MKILRQKEFATVSTRQKAGGSDAMDTVVGENHKAQRYCGSEEQKNIMKIVNQKTKRKFVRVNGKKVPISKTKDGWVYGAHYAYKDAAGRLIPAVHGSDNSSAKEFFKGMLKNEKELFAGMDQPNNLSEFPDPAKARRYEGKEITNKDIKDAIRKLEKQEKIKKISKKTAIIGVPVAAAAIGTGVAIKKHKDKKKEK